MEKLKILVSAYACSPNSGSEPGMGWNFVRGLSRYHEVHVITEKRKWEVPINTFLEENPALRQNLKFYFIDKKRNKKLRKIWPPSYYWFYQKWQKKAYNLVLELDKKENFDLLHQLNMVGYREPGFLWKIEKPFVWGPIGGLENSPWKFLPTLGIQGFLFYAGRNILNWWQRSFKKRPKKAASRPNNILISATTDNSKFIKRLWNKDSYVMSEVGCNTNNVLQLSKRKPSNPISIVWSGLHIPRKNLPLLLLALKGISIPYKLHILGEGKMTATWQRLAKDLNLDTNCVWHGWLPHREAIEIMQLGHVLCITSISDLTSTVTLEGLSQGLPIVCLDHCGFAHVVTEKCGIVIPVDTPKKAANNFRQGLEKLYHNEKYRQELSKGALIRSGEFSWENKIEDLNKIYAKLLNEIRDEKG